MNQVRTCFCYTTAMKRQWLALSALVLVTWAGAFGIAFGVAEWRDEAGSVRQH